MIIGTMLFLPLWTFAQGKSHQAIVDLFFRLSSESHQAKGENHMTNLWCSDLFGRLVAHKQLNGERSGPSAAAFASPVPIPAHGPKAPLFNVKPLHSQLLTVVMARDVKHLNINKTINKIHRKHV